MLGTRQCIPTALHSLHWRVHVSKYFTGNQTLFKAPGGACGVDMRQLLAQILQRVEPHCKHLHCHRCQLYIFWIWLGYCIVPTHPIHDCNAAQLKRTSSVVTPSLVHHPALTLHLCASLKLCRAAPASYNTCWGPGFKLCC